MAEDEDLTEAARKLFSGRVEFLRSAPCAQFPARSGRRRSPSPDDRTSASSLLNALTGRKSIARASVTPGRTQELNFFEVGEPTRIRLVDMPGYGYAKAPLKVVEAWKRLVRDYLRGRVLKRTLVLIDSRHGVKTSTAR
jgi:GTP-binding protein